MKKAPGIAFVGLALVVGGCSSTKSATRVSYAEPGYTTPTSYQYVDTGYTQPAYDRYTTDGSVVTGRTTTYEATPPSDRPFVARTVNMHTTGIRQEITLDEFRRHLTDQTAVVVDARETKDFGKGHVRGAINIPVGNESASMGRLSGVNPDDLIIVYCGGPDCPAGENVAAYLSTQGYTNIRVYRPGWQHLSRTDLVQ